MRRVTWRVEPANDSSEAQKEADFADSLRNDMSHTWDDFLVEALSMLGYGYSAHEIVYKRRLGPRHRHERDWMKLHTGDHVTEINGRHVGRGEAINDFPDDERLAASKLQIRNFDFVIVSDRKQLISEPEAPRSRSGCADFDLPSGQHWPLAKTTELSSCQDAPELAHPR